MWIIPEVLACETKTIITRIKLGLQLQLTYIVVALLPINITVGATDRKINSAGNTINRLVVHIQSDVCLFLQQHYVSPGCRWRKQPTDTEDSCEYWINTREQTTKDGHPAWGLGVGLTFVVKINLLRHVIKYVRFERNLWINGRKQRKRLWGYARSLTVATELLKYTLDLMGTQEVGWERVALYKEANAYENIFIISGTVAAICTAVVATWCNE
jgi:hypothetical protein